MDSKKFNIFSLFMVMVMCVVTIVVAFNRKQPSDGRDGMSAYEQAVDSGLFSGTELEYLLSLQGKDGKDVTVEDIYYAYLEANDLTQNECSLAKFIETYYPKYLLDVDDASKMTLSELASQQALRSTVDILYSGYMNSAIIKATETSILQTGEPVYVLEETTTAPVCLSAGSGVIYKIDGDTAYIITNYHVAYVSNYSNDPNYRVYYNDTKGEYFTAVYDETKIKTSSLASGARKYILQADVEMAPIETHFMDTYEVYLHGYQAEGYALSATFVGGSAENDIAVLKIEKSMTENNKLIFEDDYVQAVIGDSAEINAGEEVIAVGNPLLANTTNIDTSTVSTIGEYVEAYKKSYIEALCLTVTGGEVSLISEYQDFSSILDGSKTSNMRLIRVSSAINAGNSGGGLYDMYGRLVGIVNGKIASADYDNVGYAIPINKAINIADKVIAECSGTSGTISFKAVTSEALGLSVKTSKNGTIKPIYDENTLQWINRNSVVVSNISNSELYLGGVSVGDTLVSVEIDGVTYELYNDYDLDDVLLKVKAYTSQNSPKIKFNFEKFDQGSVVSYNITLTLTADNYVVIE